MTRAILLFLGMLAATAAIGCDILGNSKVDNPVFGPPPPRVGMSDEPAESSRIAKNSSKNRDENGRVRVVDFDASKEKFDGPNEFSGTQVVATVNGKPIFASEVLEDQGPILRKARGMMPPEEYEKGRKQMIQQLLKAHIQRKLLAERLRSTLEKEQLERLDLAINSMYEEQIKKLKTQYKVNSEHEVELELIKEQDTTLARLKNGYATQAMAAAYLEGKADPKLSLGRPELLAYYEAHLTDFDYPTKVKWQQISISFEKHGGREKALAELEKAVGELRNGVDFGEVAAKYSDGVNAKKGGDAGWSRPESLADEKIRQALSELEPGTISRVIESKESFRLVLINERKDAGRTPFENVQSKIKKKLEAEAKEEATKKLMEEVYADAIVETIFDKPAAETMPIRANVNKPAAKAAGVSRVPAERKKISKKSS